MIGLLIRIGLNAIALRLTAYILPAISFGKDDSIIGILAVAVIFGLVNAFVKPVVKLLSLPINLVTLGLFGLVVNGALLLLVAWLAGQAGMTFTVGDFPPDITIATIEAALAGGIVLSLVSRVIDLLPIGSKRM